MNNYTKYKTRKKFLPFIKRNYTIKYPKIDNPFIFECMNCKKVYSPTTLHKRLEINQKNYTCECGEYFYMEEINKTIANYYFKKYEIGYNKTNTGENSPSRLILCIKHNTLNKPVEADEILLEDILNSFGLILRATYKNKHKEIMKYIRDYAEIKWNYDILPLDVRREFTPSTPLKM